MKLTSFETLQNKRLGTIGTPKRDAFEVKVNQEIAAYRKKKAVNLSQEQLGESMEVKEAIL